MNCLNVLTVLSAEWIIRIYAELCKIENQIIPESVIHSSRANVFDVYWLEAQKKPIPPVRISKNNSDKTVSTY